MEASPVGFAPERYWTEEKERALITFFSKHSCLWNHKSENYKNRQLRWKTLEHLRILLSAHPPPVHFTVEDIKNKFKNLRTTFQRQFKMVKASKVCGSEDAFVPQWKHYQQLMFLQGCWDHEDSLDYLPPSPLAVSHEEKQSTLPSPGPTISFRPNPSTSSTNMMVKCCWTEESERALIAFYSEHSCLWNKRSESHNNRQLRQRLLEALRIQLSDHTVSFSVDDIKCKFKNLRTVFNREHKLVRARKASDKFYVSKWKHYQQLLFLYESCDEDESLVDLHILSPQEDKDQDHGCKSFSSTQTHKFNNPTTVTSDVSPTSSSSAYQIFLSTSTDHLKLESQTAAPTSPSASLSDNKPRTNNSSLKFFMSTSGQPDCRLSADSRCHWSEAKVQQLISFYSEHSCLWNHRSESYRNRLLKQSLLETLGSLLSENESVLFTVEDIKTKFRNLRTIFQREHKAVSSNKTCGSEDFYLPKWKHYRELMFLCDSCDEEEPHDSSVLTLGSQDPPCPLYYNGVSQMASLTSHNLKAPPSPTPPDSQHSSPSSSPSTSSSHPDSRVSGRKRASRHLPSTSSDMLDFMRTLCQSQMSSPHAGFLKYVEECLSEMPPNKVKKLKKKIIDTIHSVSEEV